MGGQIQMGSKVTGCAYDEKSETWQLRYRDQEGNVQTIEARACDLVRADAGIGSRLDAARLRQRPRTPPTASSIATSSRSC